MEKLPSGSKSLEEFTYAGIGSRETPPIYQDKLTKIAEYLSDKYGAILRSGNAIGADQAFQKGALAAEVFLPWPSYNGGHPKAVQVDRERLKDCYHLVGKVHPNPRGLTTASLSMHARNANIILGKDLNDPVKFVLYWNHIGKKTGGTVIAIEMAKLYNLPIFNLASKTEFDEFVLYIKSEEEKFQ